MMCFFTYREQEADPNGEDFGLYEELGNTRGEGEVV
jgi:hypothetical protein